MEQSNLEKEILTGNNNQVKKIILTDDTKGTMTKDDVFRELEQLGLPSWTWNTNLPSRVSLTEIADAPSFTPMDESIKETDDTRGTTTKAEFFGELEQLDLDRETIAGNTNLLSRVSFTEIADTPSSTPMEDFIKKI